jgi:hypothetical protein
MKKDWQQSLNHRNNLRNRLIVFSRANVKMSMMHGATPEEVNALISTLFERASVSGSSAICMMTSVVICPH